MSTFAFPLTFAFGRTYSGLAASVLYTVIDSTGTVRIASTGTGVTEETDYNGNSTTGTYYVEATLDNTWGPCRAKAVITGYAGVEATSSFNTTVLDAIVGSVSGAVGSVTGNVGGNVAGSVASVSGNVGGNVNGTAAGISGVTFPTNFSSLSINVSGYVTYANAAPPSTASIAAAILATPANLLVTNASGQVTYSNSAPPTTSQIAAVILKTPSSLLATDSSGDVTFNNTSIATVGTVTNPVSVSGTLNVNVSEIGGLNVAVPGSGSITFSSTIGTSTYAGGAVASVTGGVGGSVAGSVASVTGNVGGSVGSVTSPVTVGTNEDKTGYSLSVAPPTASAIATQVWETSNTVGDTSGLYGYVLNNASGGGGGGGVVTGYAEGQDPATLVLGASASAWTSAGTIGYLINLLAAIYSKVLSFGSIVVNNTLPVSPGGAISISNGRAYESAEGNALVWAYTGPFNLLQEGTTTTLYDSLGAATIATAVVTGTLTNFTITINLASSQTAASVLRPGTRGYEIQWTVSSNVFPVFDGVMTVSP